MLLMPDIWNSEKILANMHNNNTILIITFFTTLILSHIIYSLNSHFSHVRYVPDRFNGYKTNFDLFVMKS